MNKYLKKKKAIRLKNKKLIKKYPWLKPYNVWTGKTWDDYNYEYTWWDDVPAGWRISFGDLLLEELQEASKGKIDFQQIKEKYGQLRIYAATTQEAQDVITKYGYLSENICINCGKPDVHMLNTGWISPLCEECFTKNKYYKDKNYSDFICDESNEMASSYTIRRYSIDDEGAKEITYDISDTAEKIRSKWRGTHE